MNEMAGAPKRNLIVLTDDRTSSILSLSKGSITRDHESTLDSESVASYNSVFGEETINKKLQ